MNAPEQKQTTLAQSPCWEAVDAVVCINLDRRTDRWRSFCKTVKDVIPEGKICRLSGVEGTKLPGFGEAPWFTERTKDRTLYWGGATGCMMAHACALRLAQQNGWRNVMILEDDVAAKITPDGLEMMRHALTHMTGRYLLYLGYSKRVPRGIRIERKGEAALWRIDGALTTHAYVVPASMYQPLLDALPDSPEKAWEWMSRHRAIDTFYRNEVAAWSRVKICAVLPLMFHQNGMSSDLINNMKIAAPAQEEPVELSRLVWLVYRRVATFCRRLKTCLNSYRTYRRALRGGFPGYRKKKKFFRFSR